MPFRYLAQLGRVWRPFSLRADDALELRVFPFIVRYSTHPAHIAFLIVLWVALLVFGGYAVFALTGGNYFNGLCGIVSCVLLGQQMKHHHEVKKLHTDAQAERSRIEHKHADELAKTRQEIEMLADYVAALREDVASGSKAETRPAAKPVTKKPATRRSRGKSQWDPMDPIEEE